ncbi:DUF4926 domain-containing protein [Argonema antarcticum]|uniref:DUF4926 domain-containing protein n=1 Tax=Argonema antarcticum TaxID=2942763 RepID=UPI002012DB54|nr:DUF4926 domain-containing protein [Argonema antarcticum]MCL1474491.1 DUF4926 domain-containing protein [Argonema antarcticum A004/B2]
MQFEMFSEVSLKEDITEYNLPKGTTAIIVDFCPRPEGQEDGYVLEVLNEEGKGFTVIAVAASKIEQITVMVPG